jgi:hypothetical protein
LLALQKNLFVVLLSLGFRLWMLARTVVERF